MTFQSSYAKLLADPTFGQISKRKEHAKQMYVAGLKQAIQCCEGQPDGADCVARIEEAIAEESK